MNTHRDTLAAAVVTPIGTVLAHTDVTADARGYRELLDFARRYVPGPRSSAVLAATAAINPLKALIVSAPEDLRSELRGKSSATPIPASSGMTHRHRLNRGGDRQFNRALHTITLIRMRVGPATRAYVAKRAPARTIFKLLERTTAASGYR